MNAIKKKHKRETAGWALPFELSFLLFTFLALDSGNVLLSKVSGSRKLENGLVVPATLFVQTERTKIFEKPQAATGGVL